MFAYLFVYYIPWLMARAVFYYNSMISPHFSLLLRLWDFIDLLVAFFATRISLSSTKNNKGNLRIFSRRKNLEFEKFCWFTRLGCQLDGNDGKYGYRRVRKCETKTFFIFKSMLKVFVLRLTERKLYFDWIVVLFLGGTYYNSKIRS